MKKVFLLSFLTPFLWISCQSNHPFQAEIQKVDSLQTVVQKLEGQLEDANTEEIEETAEKVEHIEEELIESFKDSVTNPEDVANKDFYINEVNPLFMIKESAEKFEKELPDIRKNLKKSKKQLHTLKNSLEDKKLKPAKAKEYLAEEEQAVQRLSMVIEKRLSAAKNALERWKKMEPHYDSIMAQ